MSTDSSRVCGPVTSFGVFPPAPTAWAVCTKTNIISITQPSQRNAAKASDGEGWRKRRVSIVLSSTIRCAAYTGYSAHLARTEYRCIQRPGGGHPPAADFDHMSRSPGGAWAVPRDLSLGASAMEASVVRNKPATEAAFCSASRVTLVGSRMPSSIMSPNSPLAAL
jgi:hypothetical protein